jgi:hypothetical protein
MRKLLLFVCLAVGLVLPAAPAQAATTIEKHIPFEVTLEACGETIYLSGTLIGIFAEQPLGSGGVSPHLPFPATGCDRYIE